MPHAAGHRDLQRVGRPQAAPQLRRQVQDLRTGRLPRHRKGVSGVPSQERVRIRSKTRGPQDLAAGQKFRVALPGCRLHAVLPHDAGTPGFPPVAVQIHAHGPLL
ncbi:hypothetical protein ANN_13312 [Periplaneta americana]|uniref:Uncharacterized protein n=1 Tax=Periplaneta americana TaxID=6978 RepID=A0ABQ8TLG2_PERAM|nr:hypothetical protein ANN_13312 [Periplaneta americana]